MQAICLVIVFPSVAGGGVCTATGDLDAVSVLSARRPTQASVPLSTAAGAVTVSTPLR